MTGHLIHIGYAKTGSNLLRHWFADHPQLDFVDGGIAGFRDIYEVCRRSAAPKHGILYRVSSSEGLATPHAWIGRQAVDYDRIRADHLPAAQAEACATLASLFPNAHVLLVTRGFRSMLVSAYSQYARSGGEGDLYALFEGGDGTPTAWDYDQIIGLYRAAFGDRLIVLPYEFLRDDADAFVRALEGRLGLSHCPAPGMRLNSGLSPEELSWYPRITRLVRRLPIGERARRRVYQAYVRRTMAGDLRLVTRLLQRVRPSIAITPDSITDDMVDRFRGKAESLRGDPIYVPYADDYLL